MCYTNPPSGGTFLDGPLPAGDKSSSIPPVLMVWLDRPLFSPPAEASDARLAPPMLPAGLTRPLARPPAAAPEREPHATFSAATASWNDVAFAPGPHRALPWLMAHVPIAECEAASSAFFCLVSSESCLAAAFAST
ncbi:unnamed protein product, partial [Ectocarpus sp. 4 AP-2014]